MQVDDSWLHLYYTEWDGPNSAVTVGVARSSVSDAGVPGTWWKWKDNAWNSPGVGGQSDALHGMPGTAVYLLGAGSTALVSVGVLLSDAMGISWSADGIYWTPATSGPLFHAAPSSWNRNANSSELFAYAALTGIQVR